MKTEFSKGEWWACCINTKPHFVFAGGAKSVCALQHNDPNDKDYKYEPLEEVLTREECVANAKLIAAAPDLLEALVNLLNNYVANADVVTEIEVNHPIVKKAKEAIKKATE